jgi:hypothetical protein
MLKSIITLLAILFTLNSFAQITFDPGYFINDKNEKIACWIKNIDWKNNPTKFQYELSENSESQTTSIESVKEFGINNFSKYQRFDLNMDRSSKEVENMTLSREPEFKQERLFLKILVEGKATLYLYQEKNLKRYFIKTIDAEIEQLVFKKYKTFENQVRENKQYLIQLRDQLKCESTTTEKLRKLEYRQKSLVKIFEEYNQCVNAQFISYGKLYKRDLLNLSLRGGSHFSTLIFNDINFEKELGFKFGVELEYILPINKNKWAVILEPTFQYSKAEGFIKSVVVGNIKVISDYKSIEFPLGLRHFFYLNADAKIFINASYVFDYTMSSNIYYELGGDKIPYESGQNYAFGLGYKQNKFSVEVRYATERRLVDFIYPLDISYKSLSLIIGYSIFKKKNSN